MRGHGSSYFAVCIDGSGRIGTFVALLDNAYMVTDADGFLSILDTSDAVVIHICE